MEENQRYSDLPLGAQLIRNPGHAGSTVELMSPQDLNVEMPQTLGNDADQPPQEGEQAVFDVVKDSSGSSRLHDGSQLDDGHGNFGASFNGEQSGVEKPFLNSDPPGEQSKTGTDETANAYSGGGAKTDSRSSTPQPQLATDEDMAAGNFVRVGERPLLPGWPADHWYHTYLQIPVMANGKWTGEFVTYGVLGDEGSRRNQQVRASDKRNSDKLGSNRNHTYDVRITPEQREALAEGAEYWSQWQVPGHQCPSCGRHYILGGPLSARGGYNSNTWVYNMLIHNPAGRIEPPAIVPSPGWKVNDVAEDYYPKQRN